MAIFQLLPLLMHIYKYAWRHRSLIFAYTYKTIVQIHIYTFVFKRIFYNKNNNNKESRIVDCILFKKYKNKHYQKTKNKSNNKIKLIIYIFGDNGKTKHELK